MITPVSGMIDMLPPLTFLHYTLLANVISYQFVPIQWVNPSRVLAAGPSPPFYRIIRTMSITRFWNQHYFLKEINKDVYFPGCGPVSSSGKMLDYGLDSQSSTPGVRGVEIFLHSFVSRLVLGSTQPPMKWVPGAFSGVKAAKIIGLATLPLCSAVAVNMWTLASTSPMACNGNTLCAWIQLFTPSNIVLYKHVH